MSEGLSDDTHQMCLLSFVHNLRFLFLLKTYLFGMFVLYTNLIGFVNRFFEKFIKNFLRLQNRIVKRKVNHSLRFYERTFAVSSQKMSEY